MHFPSWSKVLSKTCSNKFGLNVWTPTTVQQYENMSGNDVVVTMWYFCGYKSFCVRHKLLFSIYYKHSTFIKQSMMDKHRITRV